jgi:protein-disulfide isomerase
MIDAAAPQAEAIGSTIAISYGRMSCAGFHGGGMSKREELRERRGQERARRRLTYALVTVGMALILVAVLMLPNFTPAGDFVTVTARAWPQSNGTSLGDPQAPVLVEVFEDFQCPACRRFNEAIEPPIIDAYVATGKARLAFLQYPFIGNESLQAAKASLCAAELNRFWDYKEILFANQTGENVGAFLDSRLVAFAESIGIDAEDFRACLNSDRYDETIAAEFQRGNEMGTTGTPSVFVNGVQVAPGFVPSVEQLTQAIEAALASSGGS